MTLAEEDARLLARAAARTGADGDLAQLAHAEGVDFATAVLYERLLRSPANAAFLRQAQTVPAPGKLPADLIGVMPGAFHREHRHTGADGLRVLAIARALGCEAEVIPTASCGTLAENARTLLDWLAANRGRRIALISLSKGGAEVKWALAQPEASAAFSSVSAWVSFSGLVQGTPLIAWLRRQPLRWWGVRLWLWWHGYSIRALEELAHGPGTPLANWPALPPHLRIVHVFGFPLRRHLAHPWAHRGYARLAPLGPNDGGAVLLSDTTSLPGIVCPLWGVDHYLAPSMDILPLLTGIVAAALDAPAVERAPAVSR